MDRDRKQLIRLLHELAILLDLDGANKFKSGAYDKAARTLEDNEVELRDAWKTGTLTEIEGIGKGIAEKIEEYFNTGGMRELAELRERIPRGLIELTQIPGLGSKKARTLHQELGIASVIDLEAACKDGRVENMAGFGRKSVENILNGIEQRAKNSGRFRLDVADSAANQFVRLLRDHKAVQRAEIAGSLRRRRETVKDLDFVVATKKPLEVMNYFTSFPGVARVLGSGDTKASVVLESGMQADLRCVSLEQFPFALHHFTGSREHNTALRRRAKERNLTMNEYGLFPEGSETSLKAKTEEEVFRLLDLDFIPPELREGMGEIEAAEKHTLPNLISRSDIHGAAHMHTRYSDGLPTVVDYAEAAEKLGLEWLGIADHSQSAGYAGGLNVERVGHQQAEIDDVNDTWRKKGIRLLKGIESDILPDGSLDYPESVLQSFDFIVGSVHSQFNLPEELMTDRVICAVRSPYLTILGHMTGRLLLRREGFALDQKAVIRACAEEGVAIELNGNPWRLDMDWRLVRYGLEQGAMFSLGPDAHALGGLEHIFYAMDQGRKGWLTPDRCINTFSADEFLEFARKHRNR